MGSAPGVARRGRRRSRPARHDAERRSFFRRNFLPPTVFGLVVLVILVAAVTGFAGAVLWAVNDSEYIRQGAPAAPPPDRSRADEVLAESETTTTTKPDLTSDGVAEKLGPSVWSVTTLDSAGQPVGGSAFTVGASGNRGLLVTSLSIVEASTREPGPEIQVKGTSFEGAATLWTWDERRDLALLVVDRGNAPALEWAADTPLAPGDRIFALGDDRQVRQGTVVNVMPGSIEHDVVVDDTLRGGPLVNRKGELVAVSSAAYTGGGTPTDTAYFGVPIQDSCGRVLRCGGGSPAPAAAADRPDTTTTVRPRGTVPTRS